MKNRKRKSAAALAAGMSVLLGAGTIAGATEQTDNNKISREETVDITAARGAARNRPAMPTGMICRTTVGMK